MTCLRLKAELELKVLPRALGLMLLEAPKFASALLGGLEWFLSLVDHLPLAYELLESKIMSSLGLYLPVSLGHLGPERILGEWGLTNEF